VHEQPCLAELEVDHPDAVALVPLRQHHDALPKILVAIRAQCVAICAGVRAGDRQCPSLAQSLVDHLPHQLAPSTQEADDLLFGKPLLHVQSPSVEGLDSKPLCYSKPGDVGTALWGVSQTPLNLTSKSLNARVSGFGPNPDLAIQGIFEG